MLCLRDHTQRLCSNNAGSSPFTRKYEPPAPVVPFLLHHSQLPSNHLRFGLHPIILCRPTLLSLSRTSSTSHAPTPSQSATERSSSDSRLTFLSPTLLASGFRPTHMQQDLARITGIRPSLRRLYNLPFQGLPLRYRYLYQVPVQLYVYSYCEQPYLHSVVC